MSDSLLTTDERLAVIQQKVDVIIHDLDSIKEPYLDFSGRYSGLVIGVYICMAILAVLKLKDLIGPLLS